MSREIFFGPGTNPDISYWFFKTMTGLTGVGLYCIMVVIFVFTLPLIRKKAYRFFWMVRQREGKFFISYLKLDIARPTSCTCFSTY